MEDTYPNPLMKNLFKYEIFKFLVAINIIYFTLVSIFIFSLCLLIFNLVITFQVITIYLTSEKVLNFDDKR